MFFGFDFLTWLSLTQREEQKRWRVRRDKNGANAKIATRGIITPCIIKTKRDKKNEGINILEQISPGVHFLKGVDAISRQIQ